MITSLTWRRDGAAPRLARRVEIEKREDVRFSSGDIQLAGTLISPNTDGKHPAMTIQDWLAKRIRGFGAPR